MTEERKKEREERSFLAFEKMVLLEGMKIEERRERGESKLE